MRHLILPVFIAFLGLSLSAQDIKTDFNDAEFFLAQEDFQEALYAFGKVYNNGYQDNAYVNYRMGECLVHIPGRKTEAIPYLEKAVKSISTSVRLGKLGETNAPPEAYLYLGNAYRVNMDISKATDAYNAYEPYMDDKDLLIVSYVNKQKEACANLMQATSNPVEYREGHLGQLRETHANLYNMVVSDDAQTLAYMGKNPFYNGVYVAIKEGEVWGTPKNITPSIASDGNMDVVALSPDGKRMLLAVMDEFSSNIYEAVYENDRWNNASEVGKPINTRYFESTASYSPDGSAIYFSSNRKESLGGTDIYRSDLQEDGTWSEAVNLGEVINTDLNEEGPYLSPDGKRLYFCSQGHSTIGGYDVFYSDMQEDGTWGTATNIGYPLNTPDDDFPMIPEGFEQSGLSYIHAHSKLDGFDVFKFEMIERSATPVPVALEEPSEEELATQAAEAAAAQEAAAAEEAEKAKEAEEAAQPVPVPSLEEYLLDPIFFAFESYRIDQAGKAQLDELVRIMSEYASVIVEIDGHADAVGTDAFNNWLSEERAKAAFDYLVEKGIDGKRLKVAGKGESFPIARNRTEDNRDAPEGRKYNRRVEFHVSVVEGVKVEMAAPEIPDHLKL